MPLDGSVRHSQTFRCLSGVLTFDYPKDLDTEDLSVENDLACGYGVEKSLAYVDIQVFSVDNPHVSVD